MGHGSLWFRGWNKTEAFYAALQLLQVAVKSPPINVVPISAINETQIVVHLFHEAHKRL